MNHESKRVHEIALADKIEENPKRFYWYSKRRVTRERTSLELVPLSINAVICIRPGVT